MGTFLPFFLLWNSVCTGIQAKNQQLLKDEDNEDDQEGAVEGSHFPDQGNDLDADEQSLGTILKPLREVFLFTAILCLDLALS